MPGLPNSFPIYPSILSFTNEYHTSLSIPGINSEISNGVGITSSTSILVPNIDYLVKFANGDLGISDKMKRDMIQKNVNQCKDIDSLNQFSKLSGISIQNPDKYLKENGGFKIPVNSITFNNIDSLNGIKSMEKSVMKSIFESQKPYMEIVNLVIGSLSKIEDIIARSVSIIAPSPSVDAKLSIKSEKPKTNSGLDRGGSPKSIGYLNGEEIKGKLGKLNSLSKRGSKITIDRDGNTKTSPDRIPPGSDASSKTVENTNVDTKSNYEVVSTIYSTGTFKSEVNYNYLYRDLKDDSFSVDDLPSESEVNFEDDSDPYQALKPKRIIFGIFDSQGFPLNPNKKIKSFGPNGDEIDTPYSVADWILRSPKWWFSGPDFLWPRFRSPFYLWERGGQVIEANAEPDRGGGSQWDRRKYEDGDRKGEFIITKFAENEEIEYRRYYDDIVTKKLDASNGLDISEKAQYKNEILSKLDEKDGDLTQIQTQIENSFKYGVISGSIFKEPGIPDGLKFSFKPGKIKINNPSVGNLNEIWIDPEADYDMKVIRVDSALDIKYQEVQNDVLPSTQILGFVKNTLSISIDDNGTQIPFSISVSKNDESESIFENITEYQLDNWDYNDNDGILGIEKPTKDNTNLYNLSIWRYVENSFFIGKSLISFDNTSTSNGNSIEMERNGSEWLYREFNFSNLNETLDLLGTSLNSSYIIDVTGSPIENGEIVTKIKIQNNATLSGNEIKITSFYYQQVIGTSSPVEPLSNDLKKWYNSPPSSWNIEDFTFNWTKEESVSLPNGNLPNTKKIEITKYTINKVGSNSSSYWKMDDIKKETQIREYKSVSNGEKLLGDGSLIEVDGDKVTKWIVWRRSISSGDVLFDGGPSILPDFERNNSLIINYNYLGNNNPNKILWSGPNQYPIDILITTNTIPSFQIRVKDDSKYGKMIDPSKITNDHLTNPELYSTGKYGPGSFESPQEVEMIKRYMLTELDIETYYIIEGVLSDENLQNGVQGSSINNNNALSGNVGVEWYRMPHALGATKVLMSLITDIVSKLIPSIKKLLKLFKNPSSFLTDIIFEKLGESFSIFSPDALSVMRQLPGIPNDVRKNFVKNSILSNHIFVDDEGEYKFLFDGVALTQLSLLGITSTFGIDLRMKNVNPFKLVFAIDFNEFSKTSLKSFLNKENNNPTEASNTANLNLNSNMQENSNQISSTINGKTITEEVSIQYSTGKFIEGVDYQYIYLTEYVNKLIKEADDLEMTDQLESLELSQSKLEMALKSDPNNSLIREKLDNLKKKIDNFENPLLKTILGIVTLPIKLVSKIIEKIMEFFEQMKNLTKLPSITKDFLSFKWIAEFFTPTKLLDLAGVKFDVSKLYGWVSNLKNYPDDHEFDLSEVMDISFVPTIFKVKKGQFIDMLRKPLRVLSPILCFFESIVNAIVDFIWSLLGIESVIAAPHIKICKDLNQDPTPQDIMDLLNGLLKDPFNDSGKGDGDYSFIYDIKLSDGRSVRDLNEEELKKFIEENKDVSFDFSFD